MICSRLAPACFAVASVLAVVGCGGSDQESAKGGGGAGGSSGSSGGTAGASSGGTGGAGATGGTAGAPSTPSYAVSIGPITVQPGDEDTRCVVKRLGNAEPIQVGRISNSISSSSHHLIVYRTNATVERPTPFACTPFLDTLDPSNGAPLVITQKYDDVIELPTGVGYTLEAGQMVRLELHYINTTPSAVDVTATSTLSTMVPGTFEHEADFLFIGTPDIDLPARSASTVGPVFFPVPQKFEGVNFFAITGHTHGYGTNVHVDTRASATGMATSVYDVPGWSWNEPATVPHDPPFQIPAGGGFGFECQYDNTSGQRIGFGESANQEMCFFWAYYYPSRGASVCFHTEQFLGGIDACCPDNPLCGAFFR